MRNLNVVEWETNTKLKSGRDLSKLKQSLIHRFRISMLKNLSARCTSPTVYSTVNLSTCCQNSRLVVETSFSVPPESASCPL